MDMLQDWLSEIDTAKGMVSDTTTKRHIEAEALSNLYLLMELHSGSLGSSLKSTYKTRLTTAYNDMNLADTLRSDGTRSAMGMRITPSKSLEDWLESL